MKMAFLFAKSVYKTVFFDLFFKKKEQQIHLGDNSDPRTERNES